MRVLVTRPAEDARATAEALRKRGHEPILAPLFSIRPLQADFGGRFDAVVATSANALRALDAHSANRLAKTPLFAVGDATAAAGRARGFHDIRSARGDADDLARLVQLALPTGGRMLRLAGRDRRDAPFMTLSPTYQFTLVETYEAVAEDALPPDVSAMLHRGAIGAVLHFSPRAAKHFADLMEALPPAPDLLHVCISAAARDQRFTRVRVAARPTTDALLAALDADGLSS
jgi:uroporphyrinogen-III synthase